MYCGAHYLFIFFKDGLPTHYSLDGNLSMHSMFSESNLPCKDVNAFFKVAEVLFCSVLTVGMQKQQLLVHLISSLCLPQVIESTILILKTLFLLFTALRL